MARVKKLGGDFLQDDPITTRSLDGLLGFNLRRAREASFAAFARRVGNDHIWSGWFALLMIIHENPGLNQTNLTNLSSAIGRDKSTLTTSLRQLEREALVIREPSPGDRRSYGLRLTELGEAQLETMRSHAQEHDRVLDQIVGKENKRVLVKILRKIAGEVGRT